MTPTADGRNRDLRGLVLCGVGWMMASQGSLQLFALLTSVVIARLLTPLQLGLAAEATVFVGLALFITDFGVGAVIIQRPALTETDKSTAFWVSILMGIGMTLVGVGLSWPISALFGQPEVQRLFAVVSLAFLLTAPGIVQGALLTRDLRFRQLELRTIVATATGCSVSIVLAFLGFGPWAIIAQSLAVTGVSTVLLWRSSAWRPHLTFSRQSLNGMFGLASSTLGAKVLSWATFNVDNLLVGRVIGAAPLGQYSLACSMALSPVKRIAIPITQVFFPAFSRIRDPDQIGAVWLRALRVVALLVIPSMLGMVVIAHDFVVVIFGLRWLPAVPVLQLLAGVGLLQALTALNNGILQSTGHSSTLFRANLMVAVVSIIGFAAGLPFGISGVALTYLVASIIVQPIFTAVTARKVGLSLRDCLGSISGVVQASVGMMALVLAGRELLLNLGVPSAPRLALLVVWGGLTYVALILWRAPEIKRELRSVATRRGGPDLAASGNAPA